jgi:hypothetical protein
MMAKPRRVDGGSDRWMLRGALICFALAWIVLTVMVLGVGV